MPRTRSNKQESKGPGLDSSDAGLEVVEEESNSDQSMLEITVVDRISEMERSIEEETALHKKEMELRKQLLELRLKNKRELEALEQSYSFEEIKPIHVSTDKDNSVSDKPNAPPKKENYSLTPDQRATRKSINTSLPKFNGEPGIWPMFISCFNNTTEACGFTNQENLKRLMDSLEGEALEAVKGSLLLPESVPNVIQDLKNLFGRPGKLLKNLLKQIRETPSPSESNMESFIRFGVKVKQLCDHLIASDLDDHLRNPLLVEELVEKLPPSNQREWIRFKRDKTDKNLIVFGQYVQTVVDEVAELVEMSTRQKSVVKSNNTQEHKRVEARGRSKFPTNKGTRQEYTHVHQSEDKGVKHTKKCWVCGLQNHILMDCRKFQQMSSVERFSTADRLKLCKKCLSRYCSDTCTRKVICEEKGCGGPHHTLMHRIEETVQIQNTNVCPKPTLSVIYRTIPVTLYSGHSCINVTAFIDEGSSATLIDADIARTLKAEGTHEPLTITWTGGIRRNEDESMKLELMISAKGSSEKWPLLDTRTVKALKLPSQKVKISDVITRYKHLTDIPLEDCQNDNPMIIIGLNNIVLFAALETRIGNPNEPIAVRSKIGWTVYGMDGGITKNNTFLNLHAIIPMNNRELHDVIRNQYQLEECVEKTYEVPVPIEEKRAMEILVKTTKRVGDRFETGLLWREDAHEFPDSYTMAEKRMNQLVKRIRKTPELFEKVTKMINEYLEKGYAHKITPAELKNYSSEKVWYLPINVVQNDKKPGKLRVVWDAAASVDGVSLNSMLLKGPDMLVPLPKIICRFREKPVAFGGDLKEMYHQIKIREQDKQAQRFLFGTDVNGCSQVYVMDVATFGATCSPSSAQFVKNLNAREFAHKYPKASAAIIENHYVDDYFDSVNTIEEAVQLAKDVRYVHSKGGFHIRNWVSNTEQFLHEIGDRNSTSTVQLAVDKDTMCDRVLGVVWKSTEDVFCFDAATNKSFEKYTAEEVYPTKRIVLSVVMAQFDPMGFIAPVTVLGKMLIQDLWRTGCDWDEAIDDQSYDKWRKWIQLMQAIGSFEIPRSYFGSARSDEVKDLQLHVFTDASEQAYGAVAYFRATVNGQVKCALVMSRSKVAPVKMMSIPRLELQAAVLGVRLSRAVIENHSLPITRKFFWTDAKVVLSWIRSDHRRYKQFVGLRIGEILDATNVEDWRWIPTKSNVADMLTKWGKAANMEPETDWVRGPKFLFQDESLWPRQELPPINTAEELRVHLLIHDVVVLGRLVDAERISKWSVLVRTVACVLRFIANCRRKIKGEPIETLRATKRQSEVRKVFNGEFKRTPLQQHEYEKAEKLLVRSAQAEGFIDEIKVLMKNKRLPSSEWFSLDKCSPIYKLCPMLDDDGILRMEGRTERAESLPFNLRFPIILPSDHPITRRIVKHYHEASGHSYRDAVKNELRQLYLIPHLDAVVRKESSRCMWCKVHRNRPKVPRMAPLPVQRITPNLSPFSFTGVDYIGPFDVTVGRRTEKRWIVLFTCMVVRAIHLEIAHGLSTQSCLMAIRRFVCRRGWPVEFLSDNGTNFKGASREIVNSIGDIEEACADQLTNSRTKWTFNPPVAPHMGGVWERLVRSVKGILAMLDDGRRLTDEILHTAVLEAEDIINTRPLVAVTTDENAEGALTPNHFLRGTSKSDDREIPPTGDKEALKDSYKRTQRLADVMWAKWVKEYAPTLNQRTKWFREERNVSTGDLVYVIDGKNRKNWVRGVVEEPIIAGDGRVRQAWVRTNSGRLKRAMSQLAVLEIE
ncbi:uncharacterized protein LOC125774511 [Anopheles funestus]|uniref:uncharacterized protein LOC125774511 n=1 Tax=Anopheles funestus TaxID=62324 RepID=UPI0020C67EBD|nr:uncharacterized protein LOC125774511 [Anopheles funestus]